MQESNSSSRPAVIAGYLGWTLDSFDYFLLIFCLTSIGREFHKTDPEMALAITLTLAFRPLGALFFGLIADRYGRRLPLMINLIFFSLAEMLTGFAPDYKTFLFLRALFGMSMGGEWGVSASLVMEEVPKRLRGIVSGFLQQGFAAGNILAAILYFSLFERFGWRPLFVIGGLPALLVLYVRAKVNESAVWERHRVSDWSEIARLFVENWKLFVYITVFIAVMSFAGHGTGDMYPTLLQRQWHFGPRERAVITAISNIGAIAGAMLVGYLSDKWGRRVSIVVAVSIAVFIIPLWAFPSSLALLVTGAILMQFTMQGSWGVVPAYLAEIAPNGVRGSLPGIAYQIGAFLSSTVVYIEATLAQRTSYASAMALTALICFILVILTALLGQPRQYEIG